MGGYHFQEKTVRCSRMEDRPDDRKKNIVKYRVSRRESNSYLRVRFWGLPIFDYIPFCNNGESSEVIARNQFPTREISSHTLALKLVGRDYGVSPSSPCSMASSSSPTQIFVQNIGSTNAEF